MPQSFASLNCHIVFSTKHRQPQINAELQLRLFEYIGGIAPNNSSVLIAAGGTLDHVHCCYRSDELSRSPMPSD
jgi:putative transposase